MDNETAKALNVLAREQMKARLLADIAADLTVCGLEGWDATEYVGQLCDEVERIAIGFRKGSEIPKWLHACGMCGAKISIFDTACRECGAVFDMGKPFERKLLERREER